MNDVRIENQIKFTNILETFVQRFDENLNQVQNSQLRFRWIDAKHEIKRCVVPIDEFIVGATNQAANDKFHYPRSIASLSWINYRVFTFRLLRNCTHCHRASRPIEMFLWLSAAAYLHSANEKQIPKINKIALDMHFDNAMGRHAITLTKYW